MMRVYKEPRHRGVLRLLALSVALAASPSGCGSTPAPPAVPEAPASARPETVVVFIGCTFRADRTTVHRPSQRTTPYLAALAERGTWFDHMLSNSAWTRPGVGGAVTGVHPLVMGLDEGGKETLGRAIPANVVTLAERMSDAGYTTLGVTGNPNANPVFGFAQGFDHYQGTDKLYREGQPHLPGPVLLDGLLERAAEVDGPLYLQVVLVDAHSPWELAPVEQLAQGHLPSRHQRDRYDAALGRLDDALAYLDQGLAKLGRSDRLLMVTGDHAEGLKTPRWASVGHGTTLYDAQIHIPWVVHGPGIASGHRVEGLTQSIDVVPTMIELLELPEDDSLAGHSQAGALHGEPTTATHRVFTTSRSGPGDIRRISTDDFTFVKVRKLPRKRYKRGPVELYAASDRTQKTDISAEQRALTDAFNLEADQTWYALRDRSMVVDVDPSANELEHLRALGYLDD